MEKRPPPPFCSHAAVLRFLKLETWSGDGNEHLDLA